MSVAITLIIANLAVVLLIVAELNEQRFERALNRHRKACLREHEMRRRVEEAWQAETDRICRLTSERLANTIAARKEGGK